MTDLLSLPPVLACEDLAESVYDVRMWMSSGNTTSSLHLDTHENLMLQIDGEKKVFLSHPNESQYFYMDFHDKFGLSPVNVDRVDLQRFPLLRNATVLFAHLKPGDILYLPHGWWHVIHSLPGRNIGISFEWAAFSSNTGLWPRELQLLISHPGLYWAEQAQLTGSFHQNLALKTPSIKTGLPINCSSSMSMRLRNLSEYEHWKLH